MEEVKNKEIIDKLTNFYYNAISYKGNAIYAVPEYLKKNNLYCCAVVKNSPPRFSYTDLLTIFKMNNINSFYYITIEKVIRNSNTNICKTIEREKPFIGYVKNFNEDILVKIMNEVMNYIILPSLELNSYFIFNYFDYDLVCGTKEFVESITRVSIDTSIEMSKYIDEETEDPDIKLYDIYKDFKINKITNNYENFVCKKIENKDLIKKLTKVYNSIINNTLERENNFIKIELYNYINLELDIQEYFMHTSKVLNLKDLYLIDFTNEKELNFFYSDTINNGLFNYINKNFDKHDFLIYFPKFNYYMIFNTEKKRITNKVQKDVIYGSEKFIRNMLNIPNELKIKDYKRYVW